MMRSNVFLLSKKEVRKKQVEEDQKEPWCTRYSIWDISMNSCSFKMDKWYRECIRELVYVYIHITP